MKTFVPKDPGENRRWLVVDAEGQIVVTYGDVPLLTGETLAALVSAHEAVVVTEQGDLLHVERRPVVGRFIDALLGRVVPQE